MKMHEREGQYRGSTWAGATQGFALAAPADAALVAPAHVLPETELSTNAVLTKYRDWPQRRPEGEQR